MIHSYRKHIKKSDPVSISIIVPVYNVEPYIDDCLRSIVNQSFDKKYEAILINDASTDNSAKICLQYSTEFPELFLYINNTSNQGVSVSRNLGIEKSTGKYFTFVDPDDLIHPDALRNLFNCAENYKAEIVKGNNTIFDDKKEYPARYSVKHQVLIRHEKILSIFFNHDKVRGHPWGKLFLKSALGDISFTAGINMAQDLLYCSEVFSRADTFVLLNDTVYRYRNRSSGSTGRKYTTKSFLHWLESVEKSGLFCTTDNHIVAYKGLQIRTLTQLAREARNLPQSTLSFVVNEIENRKEKWDINLKSVLFTGGSGMRSVARYLKMMAALNQIKQKLK